MLKYIFRMVFLILLISLVSCLGVPTLTDTWLYYFFSSIFQGLSALFGILLVSFVFFRNAIEQFESIIPIRNLFFKLVFVLIETCLTLIASLMGLWATPFLITLAFKAQLIITTFILGLALIALCDIALFIFYCTKMDVDICKITGKDLD